MGKLLSVIVPVYKVEKYLQKCVDSIQKQTYSNLEIILVDDGSPDRCPDICDMYAKTDSRIKVIHKENGGLSDARNAGMKIATGEYIAFVDSDDWLEESFYEECMFLISKYYADIASTNVCYVYEDGEKKVRNQKSGVTVYGNQDAMEELLCERIFQQTVWNKVYHRKCIENLEFPVGKLNEDEFWTYQVFARANKVVYIQEPLYNYRQRSGSIMNSFRLKRLDGLEARMRRMEFVEKKYPAFTAKEKFGVYQLCIYFYQCVLKLADGQEKEQGKKIIRKYMGEIVFEPQELREFRLKKRIAIALSRWNLDLYCKMHKIA